MNRVLIRFKFWFVQKLQQSMLLTLVAMTFCFLLFGYFSVNLFLLFRSNLNLVTDYGFMALRDGAALQLLQLMISAFASTVFYTGFKACEKILVDWVVKTDKS